jgi:hypothetical protein
MAKITISRIFEISKYLATKAGQELRDPLTYLSEFAEVTLRNLRNGLTFADNLDCEVKRVSVRNDLETIVSTSTSDSKRAVRITVDRAIDGTYYVVNSFGWKYNANGDIVIKATFDGTPAASLAIPLDIVIHFG